MKWADVASEVVQALVILAIVVVVAQSCTKALW